MPRKIKIIQGLLRVDVAVNSCQERTEAIALLLILVYPSLFFQDDFDFELKAILSLGKSVAKQFMNFQKFVQTFIIALYCDLLKEANLRPIFKYTGRKDCPLAILTWSQGLYTLYRITWSFYFLQNNLIVIQARKEERTTKILLGYGGSQIVKKGRVFEPSKRSAWFHRSPKMAGTRSREQIGISLQSQFLMRILKVKLGAENQRSNIWLLQNMKRWDDF